MKMIKSQDIEGMEKSYRAAIMNSISGYKPLNLLGTISAEGKPNLCIVSSVFHLGSNPPLLGMILRPPRPHNDSLKNIKTVKQYTLNNVTAEKYRNAHQTSASYPSGVSEFEQCGFTEYYQEGFKPPFVKESTVKIGLEPVQITDIELNGTTLVIGMINLIIIENNVLLSDGSVDHVNAGTVAGSGLDSYLLPELLDRLAYAKPDIPVSSIITDKD